MTAVKNFMVYFLSFTRDGLKVIVWSITEGDVHKESACLIGVHALCCSKEIYAFNTPETK